MGEELKICPLINGSCIRERCEFWGHDIEHFMRLRSMPKVIDGAISDKTYSHEEAAQLSGECKAVRS